MNFLFISINRNCFYVIINPFLSGSLSPIMADSEKMDSDRAFMIWKRLDPSDKLELPAPTPPSEPELPVCNERRLWRGVAPPIPNDILVLADSSTEEDITPVQMAVRRMARSPIIPIGMIATVAALVMMGVSISRRDPFSFQRYARYRVAAQGFTVCSLVGGTLFYLKKDGFI